MHRQCAAVVITESTKENCKSRLRNTLKCACSCLAVWEIHFRVSSNFGSAYLPLVMISCKYQEWKDKWRQRNVLCVSNKTCKSTQFKQRAKMQTYRLQNIINRRAVDPTSHAQPVWKKNIAMIGKAVPCLSLLNDVEIVVLMCQKCNECLTMSQVSLGLFSKCLYICHCLFVGQVMSDHHSDHVPKVWEVSRTAL